MQPLIDKRMFLGANPLFEGLGETDLSELLAVTASKNFNARQVIMRQGDPGESMYIIEEGKVRVCMHLADNEDLTIGELKSGEAFGEIALFDQQPRTATVITCEPCRLLVISREVFNDYLLDHPHVAIQLLGVMSKRLRATNDLLKDSMYSGVSSRLADTLNKIAQAYGKHTNQGLQIEVVFNDQELGKIAGIPGDVVKAQLRHWREEGIINMHHGYLTLLKPDELMRHSRLQ